MLIWHVLCLHIYARVVEGDGDKRLEARRRGLEARRRGLAVVVCLVFFS